MTDAEKEAAAVALRCRHRIAEIRIRMGKQQTAVASLVGIASVTGAALEGKVHGTVTIMVDMIATNDVLEDLANHGANIRPGEGAFLRIGCAELFVHIMPDTSAKDGV